MNLAMVLRVIFLDEPLDGTALGRDVVYCYGYQGLY